jgi:hypothetical protein
MRASLIVLAVVLLSSGCRKDVPEALDLQGSQLQISNETGDNWNGVELWLNRYFRATVSSIPAHSRYKVPLSAFVSGYAQRFDFGRMQITALRLTAKTPDGSVVDINKQFQEGGLAGVAGALGGKR